MIAYHPWHQDQQLRWLHELAVPWKDKSIVKYLHSSPTFKLFRFLPFHEEQHVECIQTQGSL